MPAANVEASWSKKEFEAKLLLMKEDAAKNPAGFSIGYTVWKEPMHRQKRVIVEGVRDAFREGGLVLNRDWVPGTFESISILLQPDPDLGISFAGLATNYVTYIGLTNVNKEKDRYDDHFGLMIALYRAAFRYGQDKCRKCQDILDEVESKVRTGIPTVAEFMGVEDSCDGTSELPVSEARKEKLRELGIDRGGVEEHGQIRPEYGG